MSKNKAVLFDFDGVFARSFDIAYDMSSRMEPGLTREQYREKFHGNIYNHESLAKLKGVDRDLADKEWFDEFSPKLLETEVEVGMEEVVKILSDNYQLL